MNGPIKLSSKAMSMRIAALEDKQAKLRQEDGQHFQNISQQLLALGNTILEV